MFKFKAVIIGDSGVGKTSLFTRFQGGGFSQDFLSTIGGAFANVQVQADTGEEILIGMWDTAGQERFRNIVPMYFQKASFVIAVYSVTERNSFADLDYWVQIAKEKAPTNTKIIIVGNKCDCDDLRQVSVEESVRAAERLGACFSVETSAKSGSGIDILLSQLANLGAEENKTSSPSSVTNSPKPIENDGFEVPKGSQKPSTCC